MTEPHSSDDTPFKPGVSITDIGSTDISHIVERNGWEFVSIHAMAGGHAEIFSRGDHTLEMGWAWESSEGDARDYLLSPMVIDGQGHSVASAAEVANLLRADSEATPFWTTDRLTQIRQRSHDLTTGIEQGLRLDFDLGEALTEAEQNITKSYAASVDDVASAESELDGGLEHGV